MRAIVIGAGLGGLSAAAHLRGADHDVTVIERGALPGSGISQVYGSEV